MALKEIDEALFAAMWNDGESMHVIAAAVGLSRARHADRACKLGLAPRVKAEVAEVVPFKKYTSKPKADPKPKPAPVYHHGLMADIARAKGSARALGQVAAKHRMKYTEVMQFAGAAISIPAPPPGPHCAPFERQGVRG